MPLGGFDHPVSFGPELAAGRWRFNQLAEAAEMSATSSAEWPHTDSQSGVTSAWHVDIFTDITALEDAWLELTGKGQAGPFQTFGWVSSWYKAAAFHDLAEPLILVGSRRADRRPDIILPLCRYRSSGCSIVSSPDLGVSDLYQPILSPALIGDGVALQAFFQRARKLLPAHDLISIDKLEGSANGHEPLLAPSRFIAKLPYSAWSLKLDQDATADPEKLVKSKMRRTVRQKINQLERVATRELAFSTDLKDVDALDVTWNIRADRFNAIQRPDGLEHDAWRSLYEDVCKNQHADLKPFSAILSCNKEPVGAQLGILHKGHFVGTLLSFKMGTYDRYSPGMQIVFESIKHLANKGVTQFDLSGGDQPYKRQMGCTPRPLYRMMVPGSVKGAAVWALWRTKNALRRHSKIFNFLKRAQQLVARRH